MLDASIVTHTHTYTDRQAGGHTHRGAPTMAQWNKASVNTKQK